MVHDSLILDVGGFIYHHGSVVDWNVNDSLEVVNDGASDEAASSADADIAADGVAVHLVGGVDLGVAVDLVGGAILGLSSRRCGLK